jgi:hypothetical protein
MKLRTHREAIHILQRQPKSQTDRAKSAEGRTAAAGEEAALTLNFGSIPTGGTF